MKKKDGNLGSHFGSFINRFFLSLAQIQGHPSVAQVAASQGGALMLLHTAMRPCRSQNSGWPWPWPHPSAASTAAAAASPSNDAAGPQPGKAAAAAMEEGSASRAADEEGSPLAEDRAVRVAAATAASLLARLAAAPGGLVASSLQV